MNEETGTPEMEAVDEDEVTMDDVTAVINEQHMVIVDQQRRLDEMEERMAALQVPPAPDVPDLSPPQLPEGTKRYRNIRFSDHTAVMEGGHYVVDNGRTVWRRPKQVEFLGGVADVTDPELQEWLESCEDYRLGVIIEDPLAHRRHSNVEMHEGPRHSESTPRAGLTAQMN